MGGNEVIEALTARSMEENLGFIVKDPKEEFLYHILIGFIPNMRVPGRIFMNSEFAENLFEELRQFYENQGKTFPPALLQVANVASLPGIVGASIGLPDIHSGYGFAIGNTAAFDVDDAEAIVSPGGVGFDINCGVRMLRSNLNLSQLTREMKEALCDALFNTIPVGVGTKSSVISLKGAEINEMIEIGMPWAVERGFAWPEDLLVTEQRGSIPGARANIISAKARGRAGQLGTLGSGNHYVEVQAVEEIYDFEAARAMGITEIGQICVMIHCGSRGFGHQIASDFVISMQDSPLFAELNDPQLACMPISSPQGQAYLSSMAAAANFAFVNRSVIAGQVRAAFESVFVGRSARDLDMHQVYDVAHNIATIEEHIVEGETRRLLVHRKGSTRAFPPGHADLPDFYKTCGQPVLVGGSMGTCSYVLTGTHEAMKLSFGSTCHGAGRAVSRSSSRKVISSQEVLDDLSSKGISIRVASPESIAEEAPGAYKDVNKVVEVCHSMKLSRKAFKLLPIAVIKG